MIEPIYLRYVHDSLSKGLLNAQNASALPQGFIGLYEQEFAQKTPVSEREKVLNQLALWTLFKGPVSANLAAAVLDVEEEKMKDLVDIYSSWFNSPESGKYLLYHERLRVYLLQKLKAEEVEALNEKLISFLEDSIKQAKGEEDEYYALEHLHNHMALESQLGNHYERLHSYVNQESLWSRQIQLSKGYSWSQNSIQQGIKEGARRNHEMNIIRSTVNSVKLMTQEQNSAEDILNLLNDGDYLTALKRAESWEGERQFKLYLLFIHELTIGTSKEADFRKEACKAVLEAVDQTPEDHSVLDWTKFYPELAIYKYHEELIKMELDAIVISRRGVENKQWKKFEEWYETTLDKKKMKGLKNMADSQLMICGKLYDSGKKNKSFELLDKFLKYMETYDYDPSQEDMFIKEEIYLEIIKYLLDKNIYEKSVGIALKLEEPVSNNISLTNKKKLAFKLISESVIKSSKTDQFKDVILLSLNFKSQFRNIHSSLIYNKDIIKNLINLDQQTMVKDIIHKESDSFNKLELSLNAAINLSHVGKSEDSQKIFAQAIGYISEIDDVMKKTQAYIEISKVLIENNKNKMAYDYIEKSLLKVLEINSSFHKNQKLISICKLLTHLKDVNKSEQIINEFISDGYKDKAFSEICIVCEKLGFVEDSQKIFSKIKSDLYKSITLKAISKILLDLGFEYKAIAVINSIPDDLFKAKALIEYCNFITQKNEVININHILIESFDLVENLERAFLRNQFYLGIGISSSSIVSKKCYDLINCENYKNKLNEGIFKKIKLSDKLNYNVRPYLYCHSELTQNLTNILFYQAKMVCFFEKERNQEKLDMLSEVLDIKDWRRLSA
jgi:hypothetical protein